MLYDLHTHSIYSDGTFTPRQIVEAAAEKNLTVALTDHNSVSGLPEFLAAGRELGVETVPGVEFSTDHRGEELHIVALFVRPEHYGPIRDYVAPGDRMKEESNRNLVRRLQAAGYAISLEEILAKTPDGRVNRANIATELVLKGYCESEKAAFRDLLREKQGFYVPPPRPDCLQTIAFIRSLGAVAVLAHPYLSLSPEAVEAFLPEAIAAGLQAMETHYITYDPETTALARAVAARFGLLESGGSDFHGSRKAHVPLGGATLPRQAYDALCRSISQS